MSDALVLRWSDSERALRSSGAEPVGILAVAAPDGVATLCVDQASDPLVGPPIQGSSESGIFPWMIPIGVEEAVAGCANKDALRALYAIGSRSFLATAGYYLERWNFQIVESHLTLVNELALEIDRELNRRKGIE